MGDILQCKTTYLSRLSVFKALNVVHLSNDVCLGLDILFAEMLTEVIRY